MKRSALLLLCLFFYFTSNATHIVGGIFSLQHVTGNQYELTLKMYRDCLNGQAAFDDPATVGVFDKQTNELMQTYQLQFSSSQILPYVGANCNIALPTGCTEVGIYKRNITLNPAIFNNNAGYYFSYQRCCRNGIIQNIQQPGDAGIALYMEIPSPKLLINSTPKFNTNVNALFCENKLTEYNFEFTDADGDLLKYSMVTPLNGNLDKVNPQSNNASSGPYPTIAWQGNHTTQQQILGNPSLSINSSTGKISASPFQSGTYVIAIKIEEWRMNLKIGEVRLELQFTVSQCPQPPPDIYIKDTNGVYIGNTINVKIPEKTCVDIESVDITDSLFMTITNISSDTIFTTKPTFERFSTDQTTVKTRVCWQTSCNFPPNASQTLSINVKDNGCPKYATVNSTLVLNAIPMPTNYATDFLCMTLIDNKYTTMYWGDSTVYSPTFSKYYLYKAINEEPFILLDSIENKTLRQYTDYNTPDYNTNNYKYFMRSVNLCGNLGIPSDTLTTLEQLKFIPDQQQLITVTVINNNAIKIIWPRSYEKDFSRYFIYKKPALSNEPYKLINEKNKVNDTTIVDEDVDVNTTSYCYHVVMKDTCDNIGPMGKEACSILLSGLSKPYKNELNWTAFNYWQSGTSNYEISVRGDKTPIENKSIVSNKDTFYVDQYLNPKSGIFTYYVEANQKDVEDYLYETTSTTVKYYAANSRSNEISLSQKPQLYVPNAFTPNNDGINDVWNIRDLFIKDYSVLLYNKWGQLVFNTTDKNNKWNGLDPTGNFAQSDVYIYVITYTGYDGKIGREQGNVTLLR